jgi:protein TonB
MILFMRLIVFALVLAACTSASGQTADNSTAQNITAKPATATSKVTRPKPIDMPIPAPSSDLGTNRTVFTVTIGVDGLVHDPKMIKSSSSKQADVNALEAIKKWKFKPATKDGVPVPVLINLEVPSVPQ